MQDETPKASAGVGGEEGFGDWEAMPLRRKFLGFHCGRGYILEHFRVLLNRP